MDRYDERLIVGKPDASAFLLIGLSVLVALLGVACMCFVHFTFGLVLVIGGIVLAGFFKDGLDIEYEYREAHRTIAGIQDQQQSCRDA